MSDPEARIVAGGYHYYIRTFVINLDSQPDRLAKWRQDNAWTRAARFPAVDGSTLTEPPFYTPARRGNAFSHMRLWQHVAAGSEPVLICEDDSLVIEDRYLDELTPEDTYLVLGFNWDAPVVIDYGLGPVVITHDQERLRTLLAAGTLGAPPGLTSWPLVHCFGTCAYILTPHGARRLLAEAIPLVYGEIEMQPDGHRQPNVGLDCQLNVFHQSMGARVLLPPRAFTPNFTEPSAPLPPLPLAPDAQ